MDHKGRKLVGKNFMVGQIFEKLVEDKGKACTMDGKRHWKAFNQIGSRGVLQILSTINAFLLLGGDN
jgi:hypothetical protein